MPSAVSVRPDGTLLVGQAAKSRAMLAPEQSIVSAKRFMGDGKTSWTIGAKTFTPMDVSAIVLRRLKETASAALGNPVTEAVITVPAYFTSNQKRDTKLAGEAAGLKVLQLLPEPTAAAISYGLDKGKDQTLLVYDLGGGTFDVSLLEVRGNQFKVLAVDGDFDLGGDDFDALLAEHLVTRLQRHVREDLGGIRALLKGKKESAEIPAHLLAVGQRLKEAAERAKIELSESEVVHVSIPDILGVALDEEITRKVYNKMIAPLVVRTIRKMQDVLKAGKRSAADLDRVILVGGSTRNPLVKERVAAAVKEPWTSDRVDEVVAQGAAIVASRSFAPEEDFTPIEFQNVTPFSLGVRVSKGSDLDLFEVLAPKNTSIPTAVEHPFTTFRANQKTVDISVFQGEGRHCLENTFLGGFRLEGVPPAPAGEPKIVVRFEMDTSDLLTVSATCCHLRSEQTLDVNLVSREDKLPQAAPQADIIFMVDTSGSMTHELEGVKRSCREFGNKVIEAGVDCRLGMLDFDLPAGAAKYNWEVLGPMEPADFAAAISKLHIGRLGGCGAYVGEENTVPVIEALVRAFPGNRRRIGILISDEVGHNVHAEERIIKILREKEVCLHVVGVSGSCHERLASETNGRFWDITRSRGSIEFTVLLDAIAVEITNLAPC